MREMTARELDMFYKQNKCPYCGEWKFLEGPTGGMAMNVMCDNCGLRLNIIPGGSFMVGQVLEEPRADVLGLPVEDKTTVATPTKKSWWKIWRFFRRTTRIIQKDEKGTT